MDIKQLDDAHYWLRESYEDLQRAKYHLAKSGVTSYSWFERSINRCQTTIRHSLEGIVNRVKPN